MSAPTSSQPVAKNGSTKKFPPLAPSKRITVLHITPSLNPDAVAREVVDLAILTNRGGWRPLIASSGGSLVMEAERAAVRHTRMPLNKSSLLASWRNRVHLEALAHKAKPDIIHAHGVDVLAQACGLSASRKLPLLVDIVDTVNVTARNKRLLQMAVSRGAYFRVPSDHMVRHLRQDLQLKSPLLYRIAPGVDTNWYDPGRMTAERVQEIARQWRLPETAALVITATPLLPGQGHKSLLQALAELRRSDIFTVIVGDASSNYAKEIEKSIPSYGLSGQVVMVDFCSDWPAACWLASVMVAVNSTPRGQAPELIAAQALGRPVIATDTGANNEMVQSGETAWLIPCDDQGALKAALSEATQLTMEQRLDLADRTRAFVSGRFTQSVWSGSVFEVYTAMLAQPMVPMAA